MEVFLNLLGSYCFPIVACAVMFYLLYKEGQNHKSESEKWVEAINRNTNVIEKLLEKLN